MRTDKSDTDLPTVLLVDDDREFLELISFALSMTGKCHILTAQNAEIAKKILEYEHTDLIVADYFMPGQNGVELLQDIKKMYPNIIRILLTGQPSDEVSSDAKNLAQVCQFMSKTMGSKEMIKTITKHLPEK